ncbi:MAG: hypothetical protein ACI8W7_003825 [Gammaproteobacteria bacterium]|jgi:hypothetical protein
MSTEASGSAEVNLYQAPSADLTAVPGDQTFFVSSIRKVAVLYVMTFGVYALYWFYKHWDSLAPHLDKKVIPALRALFSIFFTHSLFRQFDSGAQRAALKPDWRPELSATLLVVALIVSQIADGIARRSDEFGHVDWIGYVAMIAVVFPMITAQRVANAAAEDIEARANSNFSVVNWLIIVIGGCFWLIVAFGVAVQLGIVPSD